MLSLFWFFFLLELFIVQLFIGQLFIAPTYTWQICVCGVDYVVKIGRPRLALDTADYGNSHLS